MSKQSNRDYPLDLSRKLNVAHINLCTETEGPYKRVAIWFQGCDVLCKGCCNPELQPLEEAHFMTVDEIVEIVKEAKKEYMVEGVTYLGGEPTLQQNLPILSKSLKKEGLGLILFTGKEICDLSDEMKKDVDLIIDGRFELENLDDSRNLIGSINQKIRLVTNRYKDELMWFYKIRDKKVEINVGLNSSLFVTGDVF